jgi:hypothetical protein
MGLIPEGIPRLLILKCPDCEFHTDTLYPWQQLFMHRYYKDHWKGVVEVT